MEFKQRLQFALDHDLNVLLEGPHGCGKSMGTISLWEENGYTLTGNKMYSYWNCAVMDVHEDVKGIPINDNGKLKYVTPEHRNWNNVELVFLDEPNRAHPKVINTLYELIQFKSINGIRLPRLKSVWAAMNPDNDEYTVEVLDQSFKDRFQICIDVPAILDKDFFLRKVDETIFNRILKWWQSIPEKMRVKYASPRRVEYAIDVIKLGGDVNDVLNKAANPSGLESCFKEEVKLNKVEFSRDMLVNAKTYINYLGTTGYIDLLKKSPPEIINGYFTYSNHTKYTDRTRVSEWLKNFSFVGCNIKVLEEIADICQYNATVLNVIYFSGVTLEIRKYAGELLKKNHPFLASKFNIH